MLKSSATTPRRARGMSLVEVLVGLALGLFIVGGGLVLMARSMHDGGELLRETRIVQDLRATADLLARDLRRAGYWDAATNGVWNSATNAAPQQNGYGWMAGSACASAVLDAKTTTTATTALCFAVAQDSNNVIDSVDRFGYELDAGVVWAVHRGGARQALSDPKTIAITHLVITPSSQVLPAANFCTKTCTSNCPEVVVREFEILIRGHLPGDSGASRFLRSNVRVRNDFVGGACPA